MLDSKDVIFPRVDVCRIKTIMQFNLSDKNVLDYRPIVMKQVPSVELMLS